MKKNTNYPTAITVVPMKNSIRISFLISLSLVISGCSQEPGFEVKKSVAYFDHFVYSGNDEYYNNHPLEKENQFYNPILPGWYSDPSVCTNGEDYFMVTSTFAYFPGVPIFHSTDLVNWNQIGHVLERPSQLPLEDQRITQGIFAPAISYNPHNETYYMITTNINGGNFFVKTKDPFGEWSEPVWLRDVHGIDPSIFFDDDGRAYILNNDAPKDPPLYDGHRAIWIREFDAENEKTIGPEKMVINGGTNLEEKPIWIEGPHLYKVNGEYLLMAAEGGTGPQHSEVILKSDHPMGDYTPWDKNPILTQRHLDPQRENPITCAGHADLIQAKDGSWWSVFLACRPIDGKFENLGRETFLMPVQWSEDGFPYMTRDDEVVPMIGEKEGLVRHETTFGNFEITDDFNDTLPGLQWLSLRGPANEHYSFKKPEGYLSLRCSEIQSTEKKIPAVLVRRMQHHAFDCSTEMIFDPAPGDAAGMLLLKDEIHQYFFAVSGTDDSEEISVRRISESGQETIASAFIDLGTDPIGMKVISYGTHYAFYYSVNEDDWKLLADDVDAFYLSTANAGGFTGTTIGMYAVKSEDYEQ